jgi:hypothetical protein
VGKKWVKLIGLFLAYKIPKKTVKMIFRKSKKGKRK